MPGNFTDTADRAILNWLTGTSLGSFTPVTNGYVMLLTANPALTAALPHDPQLSELTGIELTASGYARQQVTWSASTSPAPGGQSQIQNNNLLTFGPFTGSTGSGSATTFGALVTASSGTTGQVITIWQWDQPVVAPQNQSITIPVGSLTMTQQ